MGSFCFGRILFSLSAVKSVLEFNEIIIGLYIVLLVQLLKRSNYIVVLAGGGVEKEEESSCKDLDARCENWVERKGKELCDTKKYVEKKCLKSCDKCSKTVVVEEENKEEVCKDKSKHCTSWSKRAGNLCQTHKTMVSKCRVTCGLCTPEGGDGSKI